MTTLVRIAIGFLMTLFLSSCGFDINIGDFASGKKGNGKVVTETREINEDFTQVDVSEGLHAYVTQGDDFSIEVEADENIMDLIATDIKNGKLRIHAEENIGNATKNIRVTLPEITALEGSSGAHLETVNTVNSDEIEIEGSSGAQVRVDIVAGNLELDASSGANINIVGDANRATVDASTGGNINAKELVTKVCTANASSGGNVKIQVSESLTADASSGGNIAYSGEPKVQQSKSVSGTVRQY